MKKIFLIIFTLFMSGCGTYINYAKFDLNSNVNIKNKNIAILDINIPVDIIEKNVSLKMRLLDDYINILQKKGANVYRFQMPKSRTTTTKVYKNDLYNWFFRSDSFVSQKDESVIDFGNLDYLVEINILKYEKGATDGNDWLDFSIFYYSAIDKKLFYSLYGKGFYSSILKKLIK